MATKNIQITRGSTAKVPFIYTDEKGQRKTLTGCKVYAEVRPDIKAASIVHLASELPVPNPDLSGRTWRVGIVINDQASDKGGGVVTFIDTDLAAQLPLGDSDPYLWELWVLDGDGSKNVIYSTSNLGLYPETAVLP